MNVSNLDVISELLTRIISAAPVIALRRMRVLRLALVLLMALGHLEAQTRPIPRFEVEPGWLKVPQGWVLGQVSSSASDAQDHLWVLHRPRSVRPGQKTGPPVLEFDERGNYLRGWGGAGEGYDWPESEHGIFLDHQGFVWIGGQGNEDQILKFTKDGKFVLQIGRRGQPKTNRDTQNLSRPSDVFVHPPTNELFVSDGYGNKRIIVFDAATGAYKRMWGAFGNEPLDGPRAGAPHARTRSERPRAAAVQHGARRQGVEGRARLRGRPRRQARAGVHHRGPLSRAGVDRPLVPGGGPGLRQRRDGGQRRVLRRPGAAIPLRREPEPGTNLGARSAVAASCSTRSAARGSRPGSSTCCTT